MKVEILGQPSNKHNSCGETVLKVRILEGGGRRKVGYILSGISLPVGFVKEVDAERVYRTQAEAFKG
jgi:hypothetical protein